MHTTEACRAGTSRLDHCEHRTIFTPPLFEGEEESYEQLLTEVSRTIMPADFLEKLWVQDYVYLTIELLRLRRIKRDLMTVNAYRGLREALTPIVGRSQAETLADAWAARKSDVVEEVHNTLASAGLSTDCILAQTFAIKLDEIQRIEQIAALAETRRNAALREINRHRETLGQSLRRAVQEAEDGDRLIESKSLDRTGPRWLTRAK